MMVLIGWLNRCPNVTQYVLEWSFSYHCPIILRDNNLDWGPTPFKIFNWWIKEPKFMDFVKKYYDSYSIQGWGAYVFKEKLKLLKKWIKVWSIDKFGDPNEKLEHLVSSINKKDLQEEIEGLSLEVVLSQKTFMPEK